MVLTACSAKSAGSDSAYYYSSSNGIADAGGAAYDEEYGYPAAQEQEYKREETVEEGTITGEKLVQAGNDVAVMADPIGNLKEMCTRYAAEGISPGGAADMLALTIFIDSILN